MSHLQKQCAEEVQQLHLATVLWMANKARVDMHRAFCKTSIFATKDEVQSRELDVAHCQKKAVVTLISTVLHTYHLQMDVRKLTLQTDKDNFSHLQAEC